MMPIITPFETGCFCWVELATTDQESAKAFYGQVFGWSAADEATAQREEYTLFLSGDELVGAAYRRRYAIAGLGELPNWSLFVSVDDADAGAARARSLGGRVAAEPFDLGELGRMAVIVDPSGAPICLWEANQHAGFDLQGEENAFCWADLSTPDPDGAQRFYQGLFGWEISAGSNDTSGYLHVLNRGEYLAGISPAESRNANAPPHWLVYFQTADCDGCSAKAQERGAKVHLPPLSLPNVGRVSVLGDPQGAVFAMFEPQNAA